MLKIFLSNFIHTYHKTNLVLSVQKSKCATVYTEKDLGEGFTFKQFFIILLVTEVTNVSYKNIVGNDEMPSFLIVIIVLFKGLFSPKL